MRKEQKIDVSARKFLAGKKLSLSFFEQNPLKNKPILKVKMTENWLKSLAKYIALTIASLPSDFLKIGALFSQFAPVVSQTYTEYFYFSTPVGGKNVLMTNQSSSQIIELLNTCNTSNLTTLPVIKNIVTLCDGSVIQALNGSIALNATTDLALSCIANEFDSQWCNESSCGPACIGVIAAVVILIAMVCCGCKSYYQQQQPRRVDPNVRRQPLDQKVQLGFLASANEEPSQIPSASATSLSSQMRMSLSS